MKPETKPERYGRTLDGLLTSDIYSFISPFIIEELKKRERQKEIERDNERPRVYIEEDVPYSDSPKQKEDEEKDYNRGVIIIDITGDED